MVHFLIKLRSVWPESPCFLFRVLLHSGSGFINFVFGIVIYLTALFYLLANSGSSYKPIEIMGQYSLVQGSGNSQQSFECYGKIWFRRLRSELWIRGINLDMKFL